MNTAHGTGTFALLPAELPQGPHQEQPQPLLLLPPRAGHPLCAEQLCDVT